MDTITTPLTDLADLMLEFTDLETHIDYEVWDGYTEQRITGKIYLRHLENHYTDTNEGYSVFATNYSEETVEHTESWESYWNNAKDEVKQDFILRYLRKMNKV